MGLAFKPNIDDLRESPAVKVAEKLSDSDCMNTLFVEPNLKESDKFNLTETTTAVQEADIVVFLVAHEEFKQLSIINHQSSTILDFCGVLSK